MTDFNDTKICICYFNCLVFITTCLRFHYFKDNNKKQKCFPAITNISPATFSIWVSTSTFQGSPWEEEHPIVLNISLFVSSSPLSNCNAEKSQAAPTLSTPHHPPVCCTKQTWFLCGFQIKNLGLAEGHFHSMADNKHWYQLGKN